MVTVMQRPALRAREASAQSPAPATDDWGWIPALCLIAALGCLGVAIAYTGSRFRSEVTEPFFWVGVLLIFAPSAARVMMARTSRRESIGCVLLVGIALYFVKILHGPDAFTLFDELLHWRTANDIALSGHLFATNSLLPVSPLFPGMEIATNAVQEITGLSIFGAGALVIGMARLMLVLALFLLFEQIGLSSRIAGGGTMLYMANANFLFFDAQFAYESFAIAFAVFTVYAVVRAAHVPLGARGIWTAAALLALSVTVTSHHVTSYFLVLFLVGWTLVRYAAPLVRLHRLDALNPAGITATAVLMSLAWLAFAASIVIGYLAEPVNNGLRDFARLIAGEQQSRELFRAEGGQVQPRWEQFTGFASVILVLLGLPFGAWRIWWHYRANALIVALALGTAAYPATLALRFTTLGAEISGRTTAFLFVAIAFVLAVAFAPRVGVRARLVSRATPLLFALYAATIFLGGIAVGYGPAVARLPGPYLVSADARSIEPEGVAAAAWARVFLHPENRIAADRVNGLLMGTYGEQYTVTDIGNRVDFSPVFFARENSGDVRETLRRGRVVFLVIDRRITQSLPLFGFYIQPGENEGEAHILPVDRAATDKFDRIPGVSRLFDSGNIIVYDVRMLSGAR